MWVAGGLVVARTFGICVADACRLRDRRRRRSSAVRCSAWRLCESRLRVRRDRAARLGRVGVRRRRRSASMSAALTVRASFGCTPPAQAPHARRCCKGPRGSRWSRRPSSLRASAYAFVGLSRSVRSGGARRPKATRGQRSGRRMLATTVIGVTFVVMLLLSGAWAYTDVLAELARGMAASCRRGGLLVALLRCGARWLDRRAVPQHTRHRSRTAALPSSAAC